MDSALAGKNIVLGVTGSIASYKALDLASKLVQAGANVETILSYGATQFVTPLAFRSLTHRAVVTDTFDADLGCTALSTSPWQGGRTSW